MTSTARSTPSPTSSAPAERTAATSRETFASRLGGLLTIVGVSVGLGHVWRFPYMVGKFGGAAFVLFYVLVSVVIGVPALMAEFALGRFSRRGPVGAFAAAGLPFGQFVGWFFFVVVTAATGYYTAVIGWVLYYAIARRSVHGGVRFGPRRQRESGAAGDLDGHRRYRLGAIGGFRRDPGGVRARARADVRSGTHLRDASESIRGHPGRRLFRVLV